MSIPGVLHQPRGSLLKGKGAAPGPHGGASQLTCVKALNSSLRAHWPSEAGAFSFIEMTIWAVVISCSGKGNIHPKVFLIIKLAQKPRFCQQSAPTPTGL